MNRSAHVGTVLAGELPAAKQSGMAPIVVEVEVVLVVVVVAAVVVVVAVVVAVAVSVSPAAAAATPVSLLRSNQSNQCQAKV